MEWQCTIYMKNGQSRSTVDTFIRVLDFVRENEHELSKEILNITINHLKKEY